MGTRRHEQTTISEKTKQKYFCAKDWTAQISLNDLMKFDFSRTRFSALKFATAANRRRGLERFARRADNFRYRRSSEQRALRGRAFHQCVGVGELSKSTAETYLGLNKGCLLQRWIRYSDLSSATSRPCCQVRWRALRAPHASERVSTSRSLGYDTPSHASADCPVVGRLTGKAVWRRALHAASSSSSRLAM